MNLFFLYAFRMRRLLNIFIVPLLLSHSQQYTNETDTDRNGLVYRTFRELYLKNDTITFSYYIDTSILQKMQTDKSYIEYCKVPISNKNETTINQQKFTPNELSFEVRPPQIDRLEMLFNSTNFSNSSDICMELSYVSFDLNNLLSRITHANTSSILNVISLKNLILDVKRLTSKINSEKLTFEFTDSFARQFFNNTEFTISKTNAYIVFTLGIPIYSKQLFFMAYAKPILIDDELYMYNINNPIYISKSPELILFTRNTYKDYCHYEESLKRVYCRNSSNIQECDRLLLTQEKVETESKCMTKLPKMNYATQITNNLYISVISPISITITCANTSEQFQLTQSTNFLGLFNCSTIIQTMEIKTNNTIEYEIYPLVSTDAPASRYKMLDLLCLMIFCFLLVPNLVLYIYLVIRKNRMKHTCDNNSNGNKNTNTYSNFQEEEHDYIEFPPTTYRETLI